MDNILKSIIFFLIFIIYPFKSFAKKDLDIYSITIGSGHYNQSLDRRLKGIVNLDNVLPACTSAESFQTFINTCKPCPRNIINIISTFRNPVTKEQIVDSTSKLIAHAIDNCYKRKRNAVFIFYYCGHGLMAVSKKELFLVPGNFECKNASDYNQLSLSALSVDSLFSEVLLKSYSQIETRDIDVINFARNRLTFCYFFDCCYNISKTNVPYIDSLENFTKSYYPYRLNDIGGIDNTRFLNKIVKFLIKRIKTEFNYSFYGELDIRKWDSIFMDSIMKIKSVLYFSKHNILTYYATTPGSFAKITKNKEISMLQLAPLCNEVISFAKKKSSFNYYDFLISLDQYYINVNTKKESIKNKYYKSRMKKKINE